MGCSESGRPIFRSFSRLHRISRFRVLNRTTENRCPGGETMKVYLANEVGFCFGVKRAINMTKQALAEHNEVAILGDVVHNRTVTSELEARGLVKVDDIDEIRSGRMVIRAHGLPEDRILAAHERG